MPTYRSRVSQYSYEVAGQVTIAKPSGVVAGDYLMAVLAVNANRTLGTLPSGWAILENVSTADAPSMQAWLVGKQAGANEPSNYTFGLTGVSLGFNGPASIVAYSGATLDDSSGVMGSVDTAAPYDANTSAVTTTGANRKLVWIAVGRVTTEGVATFEPPSGFTERFEQTVAWDVCSVGLADADQAVAGSSGAKNGSFTVTGGGNARTAGFLVALAGEGSSEVARPDSDVSAGTWTASSGSDLFAMIDEETPSDADYIEATSGGTCEIGLSTSDEPPSNWLDTVRYRILGDCVVSLRQGASTEIASWTHNPGPGSATTYERTLSSGQQALVTDRSDLRLRFVKP